MILTLVPSYRPTKSEEEGRILEPPQVANDVDLAASYDELRDRGKAEVEAGELASALRTFDAALEVAKQTGDQDKVDLAQCNRTAVTMRQGPLGDGFGILREILGRSPHPETKWLAAYNLSWAYEYAREAKKGMFYGRVSLTQALATGDVDLMAKAHNQVANCLLAESHFEEAVTEYQRALSLLPEELSLLRVSIMNNLAYGKIVLGDHKEAFRLLYTCLRWDLRNGVKIYEPWARLDLCYAYLEIGRLRLAWKHGFRALSLAEEIGDHGLISLALFLMGSVEKAGGDLEASFHYFERLQREFYPEVSNLPEMMLVVDARKIVNLRA